MSPIYGSKSIDTNDDGVVTEGEIAASQAEMAEDKADAQRHMAWVAMITMIFFYCRPLSSYLSRRKNKSPVRPFWFILYRYGRCSGFLHGYVSVDG